MGNKVFLEDLPRRGKKQIDWENISDIFVKAIYEDVEYEIYIISYNKYNRKLRIKHNDNELDIGTGSFTRCQFGKVLGKITNEFKVEIGTHFEDDNRDITIIDRKYIKCKKGINKKCYKYKCNKCGFECGEHYKNGELVEEHWIDEGNLLKGQGCACCCKTPRTIVPEINSIVANEETHWMIPYFQGRWDEAKKYSCQSNQKIYPVCYDCGEIKNKPMSISTIYKNNSISCICGDGVSFPEKFMYSTLKQLGVIFETQYSPQYLKLNKKQKRSDFYISSNQLIIEVDGGLGHKNGSVHGSSNKTVSELIAIDDWKDKQHKLHGLHTIRIDCFKSNMEYIKNNILKSELNELFDLDNIDWLKCAEFASTNLKKQVCDYWNNKEDWEGARDLAMIFNLDRHTISNYLKSGVVLGWCEYNTKYEMFKGNSNAGKKKAKAIEMFKDNISVGIFESSTELERQSEKLFGVKLLQGNISSVATGMSTHYKGFTFKYTNKESIKKSNKSKPVEIFKNGMSLGVFQSPSELQRQSEELFEIKLLASKISMVATGKRKSHKGYTFRYVDKTPKETQSQTQSA